ncbi:MAG: TrpB-like pyridoxal phosphate-dependent enzyme [Candidatus Desulfofervidaceae bacterium]|nr:TrpB-like pyridoxal phosphate-dependent enzyme [Candidatus Desulfofervidaceae bacterium]
MEHKIILAEKDLPEAWFNIQPFLPKSLKPPLHPQTKKPISAEDLAPIFPKGLIEQEVSQEPYIPIPDAVRDVYRLWRPTPLRRAYRLEKALGTPARIYYKDESVSPPGSHKPNTAVAQAYYNKIEGVIRLSTETGAGQWGSALSFACKLFGLKCTVYMVKVSYEQKPYRRTLMHIWGGEVFPSPSEKTQVGRSILADNPDNPGSLGIAISEAIEDAVSHEDTKYALGSVLNHVLLHQTIIGLEAQKQLALVDDYPDIIIGCVGGGSNFAGLAFPFAKEKLEGKREIEIIAVEPASCPTLTKGLYCYDYGDTAQMTPLIYMYTLGHTFIPSGIHAGGLRYHGDAPLLCALVAEGVIKARAYTQNPVFEAAVLFAQHEGIIPAPETAHAVKAVIDEALKCKETGEEKAILMAFSGHGHFDLAAYDAYLERKLRDYEYPEDKIKEALKDLPIVP